MFEAAIDYLGTRDNIRIVVLPRNEKQTAQIRKAWSAWCSNGKIIIPDRVVDGLNLIWSSDFVISGGGTMNREAAALGVPVYSIFRGKIGAVDSYLSNTGRLRLLTSDDDIKTKIELSAGNRVVRKPDRNKRTLNSIVEGIVSLVESRGEFA
jgi:predicted glycosyltransferase